MVRFQSSLNLKTTLNAKTAKQKRHTIELEPDTSCTISLVRMSSMS